MPICIECRYPLRTLYTTYSKADDRSLGKGVRLTQCPRCKRFGDKYVEHDFVVLFIDLVLIKPQVYRHLLFNRLGREDDRFDPSIIRLGILLLLFDVYLTWARIEKASPSASNGPGDHHTDSVAPQQPALLSTQPLVLQYMYFLGLCTAQTLAFHLPIRLLCAHPPRLWLPRALARWGSSGEETVGVMGSAGHGGVAAGSGVLPPATVAALASSSSSGSGSSSSTTQAAPVPTASNYSTTNSRATSAPPSGTTTPSYPPPPASPRSHSPRRQAPKSKFVTLIPHHPHPTPISTALLVSSCTKLFPLLLIIWDYDLPSSASAVSWAVIVNNVAALEILMDCGYLRAGLLVGVAATVRAVVGRAVLASVGFDIGVGGGEEGLAVGTAVKALASWGMTGAVGWGILSGG